MSEWTSVDDELPKNEEILYCYGFSFEDPVDMDNPVMIFGDGQLYKGSGVQFYGPFGHVTHWMQPTPPEAK